MMSIFNKFSLLAALAVVALLFAMICEAKSSPISVRYAGTGFNTTVDNKDDGFPVNLSLADAKGSFGASKVEISAEFELKDVDCDAAYVVEVGLLFSANVITFENQSQLFGFSGDGWMCVNIDNGHYYGEVYGVYNGGTGHFEGATGEWMTNFDGFNLEPPYLNPIGFRSISGTLKGNVEFAKEE